MQDVDQIIELEHRLLAAVQSRDMATLDLLLGEDFTLTTGRRGKEVRSRVEWLTVTQSEYVVEDYDFDELVVQHYGACAVARSRYRQSGRMGDQARNTTYRMTDVWVRMPGGWKLQVRHAQPLEGD